MEGRGRRKIPVVYYLSRNRHLEHPHFIEVPLSSPEGLYLRDVIERLNAVRGKGIAASYSWSCKRSYKNGFVWHDLSEDDLILPANGNEYVLKGSEILDLSPTERVNQTNLNPKPGNQIQNQNRETKSLKLKSKENSPSSSFSPPPIQNNHSNSNSHSKSKSKSKSNSNSKPVSPLSLSSSINDLERENSPSSLSSESPNLNKPVNPNPNPNTFINASTQTEDETLTLILKKSPQISLNTKTCTKSETLESLIKSEARKINQIRVLHEENDEIFLPSLNPKLSPASYLMQLITCGSISVKDNNNRYRFVSSLNNYRPSYFNNVNSYNNFNLELPSPILGNSMRFLTRVEDKEYFSGSIVETKRFNDDNNILGENKVSILKKSSSYNAERGGKLLDENERENNAESASIFNCIPKTIKLITSPLSECPRISNAGQSQSQRSQSSIGGSKRLSGTKEEKVIQIEERLTSGAKVVIQSRVPCDDSDEGIDT